MHAIFDDSNPDILSELADRHERRVHLVTENDNNAAHYLSSEPRKPPRLYNAQWNDDHSGRSEAGLVMAQPENL